MFPIEFLRVLRRWWYVVLLGTTLTAALTAASWYKVSPAYTSTAELLLLPPATSVPSGGNPFLALGGLDGIGGVLSSQLTDQVTVRELKDAGAHAVYTVGLDPTTPAPLVLVQVEADTPASSLQTMRIVEARAKVALLQVQVSAGVKTGSFIGLQVISETETPTVARKGQIRAVVVVALGGLGTTFGLIALLRSNAARRRSSARHADIERPRDDEPLGQVGPPDTFGL